MSEFKEAFVRFRCALVKVTYSVGKEGQIYWQFPPAVEELKPLTDHDRGRIRDDLMLHAFGFTRLPPEWPA